MENSSLNISLPSKFLDKIKKNKKSNLYLNMEFHYNTFFQKLQLKNDFLISNNIKYENVIHISQDNHGGSKRFTYVTIEQKDAFIKHLKTNNHFLYEMIPTDLPCKMYFDIDKKDDGLTDDQRNEILIKLLNHIIAFTFNNLQIEIKEEEIIILDACITQKMSYHIIINNGYFFKNMKQHKFFIQKLLLETNEELKNFIDCVPYGNNQNIRLINQSKIGKNNILKGSEDGIDIEPSLIGCYTEQKQFYDNIEIEKEVISIVKKQVKEQKVKDEIELKQLNTEGKRLIDLVPDCQKIEYFKKLKPYQKYLCLIPIQENYEWWLKIGMAIAGSGGIANEWDSWSSMGEKYKYNEPDYLKKFDNFKKEGGYNVWSLRRWAVLCDKNGLLKMSKKEVDRLFDLYFNIPQHDDIYYIQENTKYVDMQGLGMNRKDKHIILEAYLGKGKTTAIVNHINRNIKKYPKILVISSRISFAYFIHQELEKNNINIDLYIDGQVHIPTSERLVIQLESLWKTEKTFDLVVIDECESVLKQFSSKKTMIQKFKKTYDKLCHIIKQSKKVLWCDAFILQRTVNFVHFFKEPITYIKNISPPIEREAFEINNDDINKEIIENSPSYACFSSKTDLLEFERSIPTTKTKMIYHADTDDDFDETLKDMNTNWLVDIVASTPKITVGCSFTELHFNNAYVKAKPTCCVRDTFQGIMRARHLKNNKLFFSFPPQHTLNFMKGGIPIIDNFVEWKKSNEAIRKIWQESKKLGLNFEDSDMIDLDLEQTPDQLSLLFWFNQFEEALSRNEYKQMFYKFLKICNYKYTDWTKQKKEAKKKDKKDKKCKIDFYQEIKDINALEEEQISKRIQHKKATQEEKMQVQKFYFRKYTVDEDNQNKENLSVAFNNYYMDSSKQRIIRNIYLEKNPNLQEKQIYKDVDNADGFSETIKMNSQRVAYINILNEKLGLQNSCEFKTLTISTINSVIDFLNKNKNDINTIFNLTHKESITDTDKPTILLRQIYNKWSGTKLVVTKRGNQNKAIEYEIGNKEFSLWNIIKEKKKEEPKPQQQSLIIDFMN